MGQYPYNKVAEKIWGDFSDPISGAIGKYIGEPISGKVAAAPNYAGKIAAGLNTPSQFKTSVTTTLRDSFKTVEELMNKAALGLMGMKNNKTYGNEVMQKIYEGNPNLKRKSDVDKLVAGRRFVNAEVHQLMTEWAKSSIYFKFAPPKRPLPSMKDSIVTNIWASWILYHDFIYHPMRSAQAMSRRIKGGAIVIEEEVLADLRRLDVIYRKNSNPHRQGPIHGISGTIDSEKETKLINNWASSAAKPIDTFDINRLQKRKMPTLPNPN